MHVTSPLLVASSLLLAAPAWAGAERASPREDSTSVTALLDKGPPTRVAVTITDRGPEPREIVAERSERLELVFRRASATACRGAIEIPEYGVRTAVPYGAPVSVLLRAVGPGSGTIRCAAPDAGPGSEAVR